MTQNTRHELSDSQGNSGRGLNEIQNRKVSEGFEGMNYEQRRQPYPQHTSNDDNNRNGKGKRRDEL
jgi:hypothetical protein